MVEMQLSMNVIVFVGETKLPLCVIMCLVSCMFLFLNVVDGISLYLCEICSVLSSLGVIH